MNTPRHQAFAFTLIELLVVISIIGVLAAMLIPVGVQVKIRASQQQAQTQMEQISTWIENYKARRSHYPPENPADPGSHTVATIPRSPLLYELTGAELQNGAYRTTRGAVFTQPQLIAAFGVSSLNNCTVPGGNPDEMRKAENFASTLDPKSVTTMVVGGGPTFVVEVLASKIPGPTGGTNYWHYTLGRTNAHNPNSFDLWLDVVLGGRTNRICNWSTKPIRL